VLGLCRVNALAIGPVRLAPNALGTPAEGLLAVLDAPAWAAGSVVLFDVDHVVVAFGFGGQAAS
jgi:hypothetical protein